MASMSRAARACSLLFFFLRAILGDGVVMGQDSSLPYREQDLNFTYHGDSLFGKLITPLVPKEKMPVIVFVHGSGPEDYSSSENYRYLWEAFTAKGFACYSWNRPGVAPSGGQWYRMSVQDRAEEVIRAIERLKQCPIVDTAKVGLWGISQAGWVIPKVARESTPAFVITVSSPVTTAFEQECYRVTSGMKAAGFSRSERQKAMAYNKALREMIQAKAPYAQFKALQERTAKETWQDYVIGGDEMVYAYLSIVLSQDDAPDLSSLRCPVLAIWGANDLVVPPQSSARTYKEALARTGNDHVLIRIIPDADHTLTFNHSGTGAETIKRREAYKDTPAAIFAPGYVPLMTEWLTGLHLR
ncbi:alpha/beta hydrolase family protein [Taibaiella koreensis]|uniref:alpha/beta hydrolase family protein n=1 Tax=Taibaiella koreensis TaxID=1268548 RepID=UPI0013C2F1E3|nr:alpha/beta hydrolase [Taibaiella koreensis]